MTNVKYRRGDIVYYALQEDQLILVIALRRENETDKPTIGGYVIDTKDEERYHTFCENMLLYNKSGEINLEFLTGSQIIMEASEAENGKFNIDIRLDLESYQ